MNDPRDSIPKDAPSSCPEEAELRALVGGEFPSADEERLARHLDECAECRDRLERLAGDPHWVQPTATSGSPEESRSSALQKAISELRVERPVTDTGEVESGGDDLTGLTFLQPAESEDHLGRFGPYNVLEILGRGGMGIVLKAEEPSLNRIVAVKVLTPILAANSTARERFQREARAAAAVIHENVVTVHAVDEIDSLPFLVMQFVSGQSLEERIRRGGPLKLAEILRIGSQMAAGLAAAHAQGVVHRDIKPANILLENGVERVKITDFGVARATEDSALTHTGHVVGTPQYMSPEQASGEPVDHRADLFSLGGVIYTMCTGDRPFGSLSPLVTIRKVCEEELPPVHAVNPEMPSWLGEIVGRLLRKDPAKRYQSAEEVAQILEEGLAAVQAAPHVAGARSGAGPHVPNRSNEKRAPRSLRIGAVLVLFAGALLALTELAGWTSLFHEQPARHRGQENDAELWVDARVETRGGENDQPVAVLAGGNRAEMLFSTLSEAVESAAPGDTIEIRSSRRLRIQSLRLEKPLTIRAARGARPILILPRDGVACIETDSLLVLEGLEFAGGARGRAHRRRNGDATERGVVVSREAPVFLANCRFFDSGSRSGNGLTAFNAPRCVLRNCEFYSQGTAVSWKVHRPDTTEAPRPELVIENCVRGGRIGVAVYATEGASSIVLRRSVFVAPSAGRVLHVEAASSASRVDVSSSANVFDLPGIVLLDAAMDREDLVRFMRWRESGSLYGNKFYVGSTATSQPLEGVATLEDWNRLWGQDETGAVAGKPVFAFGRVDSAAVHAVMQTGAVRLLSVETEGSASLQHEQLQQLGVTVDILGPGAGYDAWAASPEYEEWLQEIARFRG